MSGGVSGGSQKGNQRTDSAYSGTTMPIIGQDWLKNYQGLGDTLGQTGVTGAQQGNVDALQGLGAGMQNYTQAGYYGLGDMAKRFPGSSWDAPQAVSAPTVNAQTAASFMEPYQKGYTNDVVDSTLANFDKNTDRQLSAYRLRQSQAGAFGDRGALGEGQFLSDSDMNRAQTEATLRDSGFTRGMQGGQFDAGNALQASGMNASNSLAAQTFNNNLTNNRQQFDVNTGFQGDANRMQAFRDLQNNVLAQSNIQSGGVGNLMNYLNLGTNTFGQQAGGTSTGTTVNSSKSKGGGIGA